MVKIKKILLGVLLLAGVSFFLTPFSLFAQENQKKDVYAQPSLSAEIRQLRLQYRSELAEYRNVENLYKIAKDQYEQLGTLAALEDGVQSTQKAMVARDKVLHTYLRLLRLELLSQPGIEISQKKNAEENLLAAVESVESHQALLGTELDRPGLLDVAQKFEPLLTQVEEASFQTLSLISIGSLQTIQDKALILRDDMEEEIATAGGALKAGARQRSFAETARLLSDIKEYFDEVEDRYNNPNNSGYKGVYRSIGDHLITIHSSLAKALGYIEELLKI